jgi:hypothetical protein
MFMDEPTTPARVEVLIDVLRTLQNKGIQAAALRQLFQPKGLPGLTPNSNQATYTISAARQLGVFVEDESGAISLKLNPRDRRSSREVLLEAIDEKVLAMEEVEPWFALFYAYLLHCDDGSAAPGKGRDWEERFNREVLQDQRVANRFNEAKYIGFRRWFRYVGLGWHDSTNTFQPNPYARIRRKLRDMFGQHQSLESDQFMQRLGEICPELDGGRFFRRANRNYDSTVRTCSTGLSHALIELHLDGLVQLDCPVDSLGWSLTKAMPPRDGQKLRSDRFDSVRRIAPLRG